MPRATPRARRPYLCASMVDEASFAERLDAAAACRVRRHRPAPDPLQEGPRRRAVRRGHAALAGRAGVELLEVGFVADWWEGGGARPAFRAPTSACCSGWRTPSAGDTSCCSRGPAESRLDLLAERFAGVCDRAAEHGLKVALEPPALDGSSDLATVARSSSSPTRQRRHRAGHLALAPWGVHRGHAARHPGRSGSSDPDQSTAGTTSSAPPRGHLPPAGAAGPKATSTSAGSSGPGRGARGLGSRSGSRCSATVCASARPRGPARRGWAWSATLEAARAQLVGCRDRRRPRTPGRPRSGCPRRSAGRRPAHADDGSAVEAVAPAPARHPVAAPRKAPPGDRVRMLPRLGEGKHGETHASVPANAAPTRPGVRVGHPVRDGGPHAGQLARSCWPPTSTSDSPSPSPGRRRTAARSARRPGSRPSAQRSVVERGAAVEQVGAPVVAPGPHAPHRPHLLGDVRSRPPWPRRRPGRGRTGTARPGRPGCRSPAPWTRRRSRPARPVARVAAGRAGRWRRGRR